MSEVKKKNQTSQTEPVGNAVALKKLALAEAENADLSRRLSESEATLDALISGQVDAVLDSATATPLLLQQTQKALQTSEARFRVLTETTSAAIFILRGQRILYVNPAATAITGYSSGELLGMEFWQVAHPIYHERLRQNGPASLFAGCGPTGCELELLTRTGEERWVDITAGEIEYEGQTARVLTSFDISERQLAEKGLQQAKEELESRVTERTAELRRSQRQIAEILGSINDGFLALDKEWRFLYLNQRAAQNVGFQPEDLIGQNIWEKFPQLRGTVSEEKYRTAMEQRTTIHFETRGVIQEKDYEISVYPSTEGVSIYWQDITERKRAEQQIEILARFPSENPNPVMRIDQDGKLAYANEASRPLLDEWSCEPGKFLPQIWRDLVTEVLSTASEKITDVQCGNIIYSVGFVPITAAGYVNLYGRDVTERIRAIEALQKARDELELRVRERTQALEIANEQLQIEVIERRRAEEALQSAYAYNRSLIEASLDPLVTITADGKIGDVNAATESVTGYSREALIGADFHSYFTDPEKARVGYQKVFESGSVHDYELEIRHKDGHLTPVLYNASVFRDRDSGVSGVFAMARDITQRKKADQELRQQEALLHITNTQLQTEVIERRRAEEALRIANAYNRSLIEASLDPLVTITADGKIGDVNAAAESVTGYSREELIGADFHSYFTDPEKARAGYQQVFENGFVHDYELEIRHKDGHLTPVLYNASVYRDSGGEVSGVFAAARDITQRKKADQELRQQEALLRAVLENLPVGVWITDSTGRILQVNPAGLGIWAGIRYVGVEKYGEYKAWWVNTGKLMTEDEWAAARAVRNGETTINEEIEIECFDGAHKIVLNSAIPLRDAQQNIMGAIIVNQDISEIKRAQQELKESKELLEKVFSSVDLLIAYLDKDFNFLRVNRAYAEADESEAEFFVGKNHFDLYPDDENEAIFKQVVQSGEPFTVYEKPFVYAGHPERGTTYWDWSLQPVKDASGNTQGLVYSLTDVTRRKKAEQAVEADRRRLLLLSQAEREQRLFAESLAQTMLILNSSLDLNEVLDRILEQIQSVIPFRSANIALLEEGGVQVVRQRGFEDIPEDGNLSQESFTWDAYPLWQRLSGSRQVLLIPDVQAEPDWMIVPGLEWTRSCMIASLRYGEDIVGLINIFSDRPGFFSQEAAGRLTAFASQAALAIQNARLYRDLERALAQEQNMRAQLVQSEKFAAMGRMLASVAHELNNPLQTIQNCLYLTQQDTPAGSPILEYLEMAFSEIGRLSRMVAQLRELYRPRTAMSVRAHNLCKILDEAHALLAPHLQNQNVDWQQGPGPERLIADCDADQIKQVFINIGMNAIEAMQPNGGTLSVQVIRSEDARQVGIIFRDTGPGIPPETLQNLFEPFFTTKPSGLGLGLSICYELVHRHNGQITAESQINEGSIFTVWLPLAEDQNAE